MIEATIYEAKAKLSDLVKRAQAGEEVIITSGRSRKAVARIVPVSAKGKAKGRIPDMFKGVFQVGPEFDEPLPEEELRLWNGEGD